MPINENELSDYAFNERGTQTKSFLFTFQNLRKLTASSC